MECSENHHFGSQGTSKGTKYDNDYVCFRARGAKSAKITQNHHFCEIPLKLLFSIKYLESLTAFQCHTFSQIEDVKPVYENRYPLKFKFI